VKAIGVDEGQIDSVGLFTVLKAVGYRGLPEIELEEPDQAARAARSGEVLDRLCTGQ
jgi:sugar phosphate isomerase/epimerase